MPRRNTGPSPHTLEGKSRKGPSRVPSRLSVTREESLVIYMHLEEGIFAGNREGKELRTLLSLGLVATGQERREPWVFQKTETKDVCREEGFE